MFIADAYMTSKIDKLCIEKYNFTESILMENACNNAVKRIMKLTTVSNKINIVCGLGNNGGDGFCIARKLYNHGYDVEVFVVENPKEIGIASKINLNIIKSYNIPIIYLNNNNLDILDEKFSNQSYVIDCIFGSGLNREIEGIFYDLINNINELKNKYDFKIISIDIPSGLNGSTGDVMSTCILADYTITFEFFKKGFLRYDTEKYTGKIYLEKIDIPYKIYNELCIEDRFIDENYIIDNLLEKKSYSHKGHFGKTVLFAGSEDYTGAAFIATEACIKSGSGLTTLISSKNVNRILAPKFIESMYHSIDYDRVEKYKLDKKTLKLLSECNSICFGPGLGQSNSIYILLELITKNTEAPIVIDADGINILSKKNILKDIKNTVILTPHLGEFSRISKQSIKEIEKNRLDCAKKFALENEVIIVLKGKNTIITDGYRSLVSPTGNNAMANGGMGDCLTGFISSFISQGYDAFTASAIAVYLHGKCGDEIFKSSQIVNARDVIEIFPYVLKKYYNI